MPDNGFLVEGEHCDSEGQGFVKACDVKLEDADMMDRAVGIRIVGNFRIFANIYFDLVHSKEESWSGCIGRMETYKLFGVFRHGQHSR